jgi:hypothetical protein
VAINDESPGESPGAPGAGYYFTLEELRAEYPELSNATKYTDAKLAADRDYAEVRFERAAKVAFVPREVAETLVGNGTTVLLLSPIVEVGPLTGVYIDGAALSEAQVDAIVVRKYGALERADLWPKGAAIVVEYVHGYDEPPEPVKGAVMMLAAERALPSTIPYRATSLSTELGNYCISQADKTGRTGIPEVDAVIAQFGESKPVTG